MGNIDWYWVAPVALAAGVIAAVVGGRVADRLERRALHRTECDTVSHVSGRRCCTTLPGTAHRGACKNSMMRSGEWRPGVNDLCLRFT